MLLARLRVRGKLAVLVATPLVLVMVLAAVVSVDRFNRAMAAGATVRSVDVASHVGGIVADLQQERLMSVGYLLGVATASDVAMATATVDDQIVDTEEVLAGDLAPALKKALNAVAGLDDVRQLVTARNISPDTVINRFSDAVTAILSSLRLADGVDASTQAGREVIALDALLRIDELNNRSAAQLVAAAGTKSSTNVIAYAGSRAAVDGILSQFATYATNDEVALYSLVGKAFNDRIGAGFAASFAIAPNSAVARQSPTVVFPELTSFVVLGRFVETKIAADVTSAVTSRENTDLFTAYGTAGVTLLVVLLIALLSIAVARSVAEPLTRLTVTAGRVARLAEVELERVADDEADSADPVRLETVHVDAQDEVGDLARAFERVQVTAARLVERQVQSRRNVAEMLGHIGRRTQNLVGRQISVIDGLEAEETEPGRLSELYRLDHIASRLRRNASSLVVLSGAADAGGHFAPLPLGDVARLAVGEIEAYTRVDISVPDAILVSPAVINDLVLMLAELMENATSYSPPHTRVSVTATASDRRLVIIDHGIGLSDERLAEENRRLAQRERLDLAPSEVLGLFVVGRLARRHGIGVVLAHTPAGGVTVRIDLAAHLIESPTEALPVGLRVTPTEGLRVAAVSGDDVTVDVADAKSTAATFQVSTLDRAIHMLESAKPWNAFELPQPALPAGPSSMLELPTSSETAAAAEALADAARAALDALADADARASEVLAGDTDASQTEPSLTDVLWTRVSVTEASSTEASLTEATQVLPAVSGTRAEHSYWEMPTTPARSRNAADFDAYPPAPTSPVPVAESYELPGYVAPDVSADGPFAHRFQSNGLPLARRVPGATAPDAHTMPVPRQTRPELDPSEARQLIEQFEFGVARALREVGPNPRGTEES